MSDKCPLCGGNNDCMALRANPVSDCWCFHAAIPKELLARIPEKKRGKACICSRCVHHFQEEHNPLS
ncbi:cysteine-rich CWC family protein [Paenibacillus sp. GCM10027627]|uniref:cysteine-rich CWC family protein n=1 Tax=unclassified Paenibacillus TaxID=185978 RepID=UPI003626FC8C